ncbi:hypothetical protein Patl1_36109 [Pistacia atlantica]|nr:hypothetical protein Patl1_36109 [Pistacia atlantica]
MDMFKLNWYRGFALLDVCCTLKSINSLLSSFAHEKVYLRTEDISEGACFNFLTKVHGAVMSFAASLSNCDIAHGTQKEMFSSLARELLVSVGYLLDIEYQVIGNDLESLWLMMLSYLAIGLSSVDAPDQCLLTTPILDLGCQLINLYGELRQVNNVVFALCKAVRLLVSRDNNGETSYSRFLSGMNSLPCQAYAKSVEVLSCSQEFKFSIHNAIRSMPEGQGSGCIRQLTADISESMNWMKESCAVADGKEFNNLKARDCAILGNSNLVGLSIKDLMTEELSRMEWSGNNNDSLKCGLSAKWIFVFFFRLYVSCRSLYKQAISLMPPDSSKKMSATMGDSLMAYSGRDWMEKTDWTDEECCPLIYVLLTMALQRLVDLNRQIKSLEYLLQNNENAVQFNLLGKSDLSQYRKKCKKWRKRISVLNKEAAVLTEFMMGNVSLVENMHPVISSSDDVSFEDKCVQELHASDKWNMSVCAMDEKSLPTAVWWIVSQNIDICFGKHSINEAGHLKAVTVHQISAELLRDSFLYEHKFVRRNLASKFCHLLEQSSLSLFSDFSIRDVDFRTSPNWTTILSEIEKSSLVVSGTKNVSSDSISVGKSVSHSLDKLPKTVCKEKKAIKFASMKFTACQSLLNLLCWMPKAYLSSKSFSLYTTYILNLERILVGCLLKCQDALFSCSCYDFFRLFVSCRRTLKYIIMASCEEKTEDSQSSPIPMLSEGSDFVLWLFKSVFLVIGLQEALSDDCSSEIRDMIFSLIDHTSYIFLTLSKYHLNSAVNSFILFDQPCKGKPSSEVFHEQNNLKESGPCLDSFKEFEAWKSMFLVMESLEEQAQSLLVSLKDALCDRKVGVCGKVVNLNKLSSLVSCFSGILWGLASAANHSDEKNGDKVKLLRWKCEPISKLNHYIDVFADVTSSFLNILVVEEDQTFQKLDYGEDPPTSGEFFLERCDAMTENLGTLRTCAESVGIDEDSRTMVAHDNRSELEDANSPATVLANNDLLELQCFNRHLLHGLLKGEHPEAAFSLRRLLIASSAILRLNLQRSRTPFSSGLVPTFIGISEFLLLQLADMIEVPQPFTFVWLDGVLSYLEELGNHFPLTNPMLTRNVYTRLIELHLRAIGKCISLQGKKATLASHETESSTKILDCSMDLSEASLSHGPYCLDEFKARLRMSFKVFIKKPSDLHLLSAVKAIERSLVGVQGGCSVTYNISTGSGDGGKVSSIVAAGIDSLDLVLEHVSGRKRLGVVKRHIQNFIAALFNVVVHLQSPLIFYGKPVSNDGNNGPDPGSVILMCVEVLTRISGKHALFQMDSWHVAQSIRIPAALFQDIRQLRLPQAPVQSTPAIYSDKQNSKNVASMNSWSVDRQFSINLFAACCKLLYTILKHHKRKGYFSWEVQEGVKCACFLRRIYEEVRQQKDVFGQHCFKFLSNYIWVYSGYGPLKTGIRREIDEALKPGVYALVDACSADDLQYLHTVFGEGPCRNTLATLQHDYKLNFRYEGKV